MRQAASDSSLGNGDHNHGDTRAHVRRSRAQELIASLRRRWDAGEVTDDDEVIATHCDLLPEIEQELRSARLVRGAVTAAVRSGLAATPRITFATDDELYAPIDSDGGVAAADGVAPETGDADLRIPGLAGLKLLRAGGQGAVYEAVQESTGRRVAVKVMNGSAALDSRHRARFDREADVLASLRHPNIVDILDRGRTADGSFFIVMELVEGRDLDEWCASIPDTVEDTRRLLRVFVSICRAVHEAHSRGVVHRDLKPSNVRVDAADQPRVLDFGLARAEHSPRDPGRTITTSGQLLGSIPWASPEQAAGESDRLDARSDVYSLGVMLYRAVASAAPYPVTGPLFELLHNIAKAAPPRPSGQAGCRRLSARRSWVDAVILRAIEKDPKDRYASAGDLADDLERLLDGRRVHACPPPATPETVKRRVAAAAAAATAAAFLTWWLLRPPQPPTVFKLPSLTNSAEMRLVRLPAGRFFMGSPENEPGRQRNEGHRAIDVREFFIATTEVTQAQYERVVGKPAPDQTVRGPDLPVHNVTWHEAVEFCRRLSERESRSYRLPREEEWEYACRAGSTKPFFVRDGLERIGWYADNSGGRLQPAATKWANCWGLFDMHGNAHEWCDQTPLPPDAPPPPPPAAAGFRIVRGGSFAAPPEGCRAAARSPCPIGARLPDVGFRVVLEPNRQP